MSKFLLQDKIAIVTGGAGGIGTCVALEYAKAGANVVVASRTQENLDRVAADIRAHGRESLAIATDVCVPEQVDNMVQQTVDRFGRLDVLVNTAGWPLTIKPTAEMTFEEWNETVALNLTGTFLCCVAAGKVMMAQQQGKIITMASGSGAQAAPSMAHYGAAKAGVINLTQTLAAEWAHYSINVNCIVPGVTATEKVRSYGMIASRDAEGRPIPPLLLPPDPEDVANLAVFLASPGADRISGEIIPIRSLPFETAMVTKAAAK